MSEASSLLEEIKQLKNQGNEFFRQGGNNYNKAIEIYSKALHKFDQGAGVLMSANLHNDEEVKNLKISILSNRSQAHLNLGNNKDALMDSQQALMICDNKNVKALYRAAKACILLGQFELALIYCQVGTDLYPDEQAFKDLHNDAKNGIQAKKHRDVNNNSNTQRNRHKIIKLLEERSIKRWNGADVEVTPTHWAYQQLSEKNVLGETASAQRTDDNGSISTSPELPIVYNKIDEQLHFEVVLLYDEHKQSDIISDFAEYDKFLDHFTHSYPPEGPPVPWEEYLLPQEQQEQDGKRKRAEGNPCRYRIGNLRVFYQVKDLDSNNDSARRFMEVSDLETTLLDVLTQKAYYMSGMRPIFHVIPNDSPIIRQFLH